MAHISKFRKLKDRLIVSDSYDSSRPILSQNKVTGFSVNFPIVHTCKPSKVCADTCYGLKGPITWVNSLNKHQSIYNWIRSDYIDFSNSLIKECKKNLSKDKDFFIRWNGVGDLFPEAVLSLKYINSELPSLPIWCVTRIPKFAAQLKNLTNVFVHFSLDKQSMERKGDVLSLVKNEMNNLFFSYQCDKNEVLTSVPEDISVLFFDSYKPTSRLTDRSVCPLNMYEDISGRCNICRRCFNGDALSMRSLN